MGFIAEAMKAIDNAGPAPSGSQNSSTDGGMLAQLMRDHPELVSRMKKGGKVSSASSRADGIAQRGKTKGRMR
jgi:hypothetical protein